MAVDTPEPSAFARGILNSERYTFLDDAPLEERRTQAVLSRRAIDPKMSDDLGALDPAAVALRARAGLAAARIERGSTRRVDLAGLRRPMKKPPIGCRG